MGWDKVPGSDAPRAPLGGSLPRAPTVPRGSPSGARTPTIDVVHPTPQTTPNAAALRRHWTLDPHVRFLNHGSFGACPRPILALQAELRARMEREPVLFLAREVAGLLEDAAAEVAGFVGARPEDLVPVPNATTGVNVVLASLELRPGDELVVTDHGYNACNNAAEFVAERARARVVRAAVPFPLAGEGDVVEAVLAALSPRTRLVLIDHVTSPTALVLPLARLIPPLRERGVEVLVDGAHAPGMLELDLEGLGADYYTGNLHKWVCAPKGAAFLWVAPRHQARVRPTVISHGANSPRPGRSRYQTEFGWIGTLDPTPFLCAPAALRFLGGLLPGGWPELRERNHALALEGRACLLETLGGTPPAPASMLGSMASVPIPPGEPGPAPGAFGIDPLQRRLFEHHRIEVPVSSWPAPPRRLLRISAQVYLDAADFEALARTLAAEGLGA